MEEFLELLKDIVPDADFEHCRTLIDDEVITSFDVLSIVSEIEDEYNVELSPGDLTPENFNSARNLWELVQSKM